MGTWESEVSTNVSAPTNLENTRFPYTMSAGTPEATRTLRISVAPSGGNSGVANGIATMSTLFVVVAAFVMWGVPEPHAHY
jgi:hypothetical protein